MLRETILAFIATAALALPAQAATTLHLSDSGTADNATQSPAYIFSSTQFFVDNVSGGQTSTGPTTLYFLTGENGPLATLSTVFRNSDPNQSLSFHSSVPLATTWLNNSTQDFYTHEGLDSGNNSINWSNITTAFDKTWGYTPDYFTVSAFTIDAGFNGKDFFEVNGFFPDRTIVVPYSAPDLFTSWTNTGVTGVGAVPEPATWAMMLLGFVGIAGMGARKQWKGFRLA